MNESGLLFGQVEFLTQAGAPELSSIMEHRVARVHSITREEMDRGMSIEAMVDRMVRAARERNARILYLRPVLKPSGAESLLEANRQYLSRLVAALRARGFVTAPAGPMGQPAPGLMPTLLVVLGVAAGCVMLLDAISPVSAPVSAALVAVAAAGFAALWGMGYSILARQIAALVSAVVFPSLTAFILLAPPHNTLPRAGSAWVRFAVSRFMLASAVSVAGGLLLAASLTDLVFMIRIRQFVGVKLMHILPLCLAAVAYLQYYVRRSHESVLQSAAEFLNSPVLIWHALLIGVAGVLGLVYIVRTGNTSAFAISVPEFEQWFRTTLERALIVRPRTKEFLLGHPAFITAAALVVFRDRSLLLPVALAGIIGQVSMVNTFAHLHTPIIVTLARTGLGLCLGLPLGLAGAWILMALIQWARQWVRGPGK
jgi:hypothetical protein